MALFSVLGPPRRKAPSNRVAGDPPVENHPASTAVTTPPITRQPECSASATALPEGGGQGGIGPSTLTWMSPGRIREGQTRIAEGPTGLPSASPLEEARPSTEASSTTKRAVEPQDQGTLPPVKTRSPPGDEYPRPCLLQEGGKVETWCTATGRGGGHHHSASPARPEEGQGRRRCGSGISINPPRTGGDAPCNGSTIPSAPGR